MVQLRPTVVQTFFLGESVETAALHTEETDKFAVPPEKYLQLRWALSEIIALKDKSWSFGEPSHFSQALTIAEEALES